MTLPSAMISEYLLDCVRARAPHTWLQGRRKRPLVFEVQAPSMRTFAERHILSVSELAVKGLWLIDSGFPVEVSNSVPTGERVLALQARGSRCVSLLTQGGPTELDPVAFTLHDLCHLAKFAGGEFYAEQVGFFSTLERAFSASEFQQLEQQLDPEWVADRARISADMNGSSVFLFAVLKMRLKMAARRRLARLCLRPAKTEGKLDPEEQRIFEGMLSCLLEAMGLPASVREAARLTSARRDCPRAAASLCGAFGEIGAEKLSESDWRHPVGAVFGVG